MVSYADAIHYVLGDIIFSKPVFRLYELPGALFSFGAPLFVDAASSLPTGGRYDFNGFSALVDYLEYYSLYLTQHLHSFPVILWTGSFVLFAADRVLNKDLVGVQLFDKSHKLFTKGGEPEPVLCGGGHRFDYSPFYRLVILPVRPPSQICGLVK